MKTTTYILAALVLLGAGAWMGRWISASRPAREPALELPQEPLYYRNPMAPEDISPVPRKDSMGMDYIPVYADDVTETAQDGAGATRSEDGVAAPTPLVRLSRDKVQKLGVRTEAVARRLIQRSIRAPGTITADERTLTTISPRFEGWIEKLYANETGRFIARGEPLFAAYSPALVAAQQEYLLALDAQHQLEGSLGPDLLRTARQRLLNWQMDEAGIRELEASSNPRQAMLFRAPVDGVVLEKMATTGMRFMAGDVLYRLADLRRVWLIASVSAQDLEAVQNGQEVALQVDAYPGEKFTGQIAFIYPTVAEETRTASVRVELDNAGLRLRPGMYASVHLLSSAMVEPVLSVSASALLDGGERQVVLVQRDEGLFEPRDVVTGRRGDGYIEIREGLDEGELVVVSANFLIDAESNLQSALDSFGHGSHGARTAKPASPDHDHQAPTAVQPGASSETPEGE